MRNKKRALLLGFLAVLLSATSFGALLFLLSRGVDKPPPSATTTDNTASLDKILQLARTYQKYEAFEQALKLLSPLLDHDPTPPEVTELWQEIIRQQAAQKATQNETTPAPRPDAKTKPARTPKSNAKERVQPPLTKVPRSGKSAAAPTSEKTDTTATSDTLPEPSKSDATATPAAAPTSEKTDTTATSDTLSEPGEAGTTATPNTATNSGAASTSGKSTSTDIPDSDSNRPTDDSLSPAQKNQQTQDPFLDDLQPPPQSSREVPGSGDSPPNTTGDKAEELYRRGIALYKEGRYAQAEKSFGQAAQINPGHPRAHYALALSQLRLDKSNQAQSNLKQQLEIDKQHSPSVWQLGLLLQSSQPAQAEALFKQAIDIHPEDPRYHRSLGDFYFQKGDYQQALNSYQQALRYQDSASNAYNAGVALLSMKQAQQAEVFFARALAQQPTNPNYLLAHAQALSMSDQDEAAEKQLLDLVASHPDYVAAHTVLGGLYLKKGQLTPAEEQFDRAHRLQPKQLAAANGLALVYHRQQRYQEAIALLESSLETHPKSSLLHFNLANSLLQLGQISTTREAVTHLRRSLQLDPQNEQAWVALVQASLAVNSPSSAKAALKQLKNFYPQNPNIDEFSKKISP